MGFVSILYFVFGRQISMLFSDVALVIDYGALTLKYLGISYVCFAWGMVIAQAFNGAGDSKTPTWINLVCFWMIQIPLAYLLAENYNWGPEGIFWAIIIAETILATISIYIFRKGKWKSVKV